MKHITFGLMALVLGSAAANAAPPKESEYCYGPGGKASPGMIIDTGQTRANNLPSPPESPKDNAEVPLYL